LAQRKAKSNGEVTQCLTDLLYVLFYTVLKTPPLKLHRH